ncbi:tail fiber domain-containing protein [Salmonella enterica]|nr:tail fiber domain-containing protein [Salmonella enterica]
MAVNVDNRSARLDLPLPDEQNFLQDDVKRLVQCLSYLDAYVATVANDGKLDPYQLPDNAAKVDAAGIILPAQLPSTVVVLDKAGKIPVKNLPPAGTTNIFEVSSQSAMLALAATPGDICKRLDVNDTYILAYADPRQLSSWRTLPEKIVTTINGQSGDLSNVAMLDIDPATGGTSIANQAGPLVLKAKGTRGYEAVTFDQLQTIQAGTGGGASLSGVMTNFIGAVEWFNGTRTLLPAGHLPADGGHYKRSDYPDLWAAIEKGVLVSVTDAEWLAGEKTAKGTSTWANRGKYSTGTITTGPDANFRVPDLNGIVAGSASGVFLRGSGAGSISVGTLARSSLPDIIGSWASYSYSGGSVSGAVYLNPVGTGPSNALSPATQGTAYHPFKFSANRVNNTYGFVNQCRDDTGAARDWGADEVKPPQAVGIWIIRANGSFAAPGTQFKVIASDKARPAAGTQGAGGELQTEYWVNGAQDTRGYIRADHIFPKADGTGGKRYIRIGVQRDDTGKAYASFDFNEDASVDFRGTIKTTAATAGLIMYGVRGQAQWIAAQPSTASGVNDYKWFIGSRGADKTCAMYNDNIVGNLFQLNQTGNVQFRANSSQFGAKDFYCQTNGSFQLGNKVTIDKNGTSDVRLKKDINPTPAGSLARINAMAVKDFTWIDNGMKDRGLIAQEIEQIDPVYVQRYDENGDPTDDKEAQAQLSPTALLGDLVAAIQTLTARVQELEGKLAS